MLTEDFEFQIQLQTSIIQLVDEFETKAGNNPEIIYACSARKKIRNCIEQECLEKKRRNWYNKSMRVYNNCLRKSKNVTR